MLAGPIGAAPVATSTISSDPLLLGEALVPDDDLGYAHLRAVGGAHACSEVRRGDREWLVRVAPRTAAAGGAGEAVAVAVDVTEVAQRSAAFVDAAKTLARDDNPTAVVASFLGGLCTRLGWHSATLWLFDPEAGDLVSAARASTGVVDAVDRQRSPGALVREVWRSRAPRQRADAGTAVTHVDGDGDDAVCAAPVIAEGEPVGVLACAGTAVPNRNDLRALEALATMLGQYLRLQQLKEHAVRAGAAIGRTKELIEAVSPRLPLPPRPGEPEAAAPMDGDGPQEETLATLERLLAAASDEGAAATLAALERICALYATEQGSTRELVDRLHAIADHANELAAKAPVRGAAPHVAAIRAATTSALRLTDTRTRLRDGSPLAVVVSADRATREQAAKTLAGVGFATLTATDGDAAEEIAAEHPGLVSLLVSDLIIPPVSASRLACALSKEQPEMRLVYLSAGANVSAVELGPNGEEVEIVETPLVQEALLEAIDATFVTSPGRRPVALAA